MSEKTPNERFVSKAKSVHGDKYDYSKVEYINCHKNVCIICKEHGEFWQIALNHLQGHGCKKCAKNTLLTNNEFISRSKEVHGDKYDYSKVEYINGQNKVCIICPEHGEFWQTPRQHLTGRGCPECGKEKAFSATRNSNDEFVKKAIAIHGDKYDYSKVKYTNNKTKIIIICPEHGEFSQIPSTHLDNHGCPECGKEKAFSATRNSNDEFVKKAIAIHGDKYDYSKVKYTGATSKVCIICHKHGEFWQKSNNHLNGIGCPGCGKEKRDGFSKIFNKKNAEETRELRGVKFSKKATKIHRNKYDYSKVEYINGQNKVCIICPEHGEFWQIPTHHLQGHGCSKCSESKGEKEIVEWLDNAGVEYKREKEFNGLVGVNGGALRFDFYLPKYNMCIEFDGEQHRRLIRGIHTKKQFETIQEHDRKKNEFCIKNGIKLIRIWKDENQFLKKVFLK